MKKEAIFAIIIGVFVGLGITFGIYKLRQKATRTAETQNQEAEKKTSPTPSETSNQKLLITSPIDQSVVSSTDLRVSGTAEADEMIVIVINDKEYITQADSIGAFVQDVELDEGGNIVTVTAIGTDGTQTALTHNVIVSSASLEEKVEAAEEDATASAKPTNTPAKSAAPTKKPTAVPTKSEAQ